MQCLALPLTLRTAFQNLRAPQKCSGWVWEASRVENCENVHLATLATAARFILPPSPPRKSHSTAPWSVVGGAEILGKELTKGFNCRGLGKKLAKVLKQLLQNPFAKKSHDVASKSLGSNLL